MSYLQVVLDIAMCVLWCLTYTFVLIGTLKYQYPLISPIAQAIIAPFEFSVLFLIVFSGLFCSKYSSFMYLYWSIIEIIIILVMIKRQYIKKRWVIPYIAMVVSITIAMIYFVAIVGKMFLFSYLNTFIGNIFWFIFVAKRKDYPMNYLTLVVFISKLIADVLSIPVYFRQGNLFIDAICMLLPLCDSLFVVMYFKRKKVTKS